MRVFVVVLMLFSFFFADAQNVVSNKSENDYFLAETYFRQGEYEKASQIFKELYKKSPFNTTYLNRLISCYQETNQFLIVEKLIQEKLKKNPTQIYLYVYLGYNYEKQQQKDLAKTNYEKAINSIAIYKNYGGLIGRIFKDYNLLDYAIMAYEKAMESNEKANYNFQIAQIYGEKGDFKKMFTAYINLVDKNDAYLNLIQRYASRYITDDPENETNVLFRKALLRKSISKPKKEWNILLSWLFAQEKQYNKALVQEKALYNRGASKLSEIFSLGKLAFDNKAYEAAKQCFDFIDKNSSLQEDKIDASWYIAKILVAINSSETEAYFKSIFSKYGKNLQSIPLQITYADYLTFSKNDPENAKLILEEALQYANSKFTKARIKLKLGDVLVYTGKYNKALIYFSQIQTQLKGSELAQQARFKVAQTSYFKGDFNWAKAQLKVLKGATTQLIANDAVDLYLKIIDNEPVDSIPSGLKQFAKAELLAYQNKNEDALHELTFLLSTKKESNDGFFLEVKPGNVIYDDVLFLQAKIFIKQKKHVQALASLEKIIAADNQGFLTDDVYFMMADLFENKLKNRKKAKEYYQKIIFEHASSIYLVEARNRYRKLRGDSI